MSSTSLAPDVSSGSGAMVILGERRGGMLQQCTSYGNPNIRPISLACVAPATRERPRSRFDIHAPDRAGYHYHERFPTGARGPDSEAWPDIARRS